MIQARIAKRFAPGPESAGFSLNVELQAAAGVTVLFGASGSGKTLTLDCIAGFVRPDSGRILLDDEILFDAAAKVAGNDSGRIILLNNCQPFAPEAFAASSRVVSAMRRLAATMIKTTGANVMPSTQPIPTGVAMFIFRSSATICLR